jgi:hypothetical protein
MVRSHIGFHFFFIVEEVVLLHLIVKRFKVGQGTGRWYSLLF